VIRELADARRRGGFDHVRLLLADEIVWHEPVGDMDYLGDHRTADAVTDEHAVARTRSARSEPDDDECASEEVGAGPERRATRDTGVSGRVG
jgi:hypothetical protein